MPLIRADIADGLDRVDLLKPGAGFVNFDAGISLGSGAFANIEAGLKPAENVDIFAFGKVSQSWLGDTKAMAGLGIRILF